MNEIDTFIKFLWKVDSGAEQTTQNTSITNFIKVICSPLKVVAPFSNVRITNWIHLALTFSVRLPRCWPPPFAPNFWNHRCYLCLYPMNFFIYFTHLRVRNVWELEVSETFGIIFFSPVFMGDFLGWQVKIIQNFPKFPTTTHTFLTLTHTLLTCYIRI